MKKKYLIGLVLLMLTCLKIEAQIGVSFSYPVSNDKHSDLAGVFGSQVSYKLDDDANLIVSAAYSFDILKGNIPIYTNSSLHEVIGEAIEDSDLDLFCFYNNFNILGEYKINDFERIRPMANLGFTLFYFDYEHFINLVQSFNNDTKFKLEGKRGKKLYTGLNASLGIRFYFTKAIFLEGKYKYVKLLNPDSIADSFEKKNQSIVNLGIGVKFI